MLTTRRVAMSLGRDLRAAVFHRVGEFSALSSVSWGGNAFGWIVVSVVPFGV